MHKAISNTAEFGAFVAAERLDSKELRGQLQGLLQDIQSALSPNALPKMPKLDTLGSTARGQPTKTMPLKPRARKFAKPCLG